MATSQLRGPVTRRTALVWAAGVGVGVPVLHACGGGNGTSGDLGYGAPSAATSPSRSPDPAATNETEAGGAAADGTAGQEVARLADVPVGGAVVTEDASGDPLVVARPAEGEVAGFSAVCTHRGCTVAADGAVLRCPCHGSTFDALTGQNIGGPAPEPLPEVPVRIEGESVVEG